MNARDIERNILVIDDDFDILNWFKTIQVPNAKYNFHVLNDELKILTTLQETDPDMIFLDICLNSIPGRKVGEIIQAASYVKVPIIYMSSKKNWASEYEVSDQFFLPKPLDKNAISDKISKILRLKR